VNRFVRGLIMAATVLAATLAAVSCATLGTGTRVSDPQGRFSFEAGTELSPRLQQSGFYQYRLENPGIDVYVTAAPAAAEEKGVEDVLDRIGVDRARLVFDGGTSFGDWRAMRWRLAGGDLVVALAYQARGGTVYSLAVVGTPEAMPGDPPGPVMRVLASMRFTAAAGRLDRPSTREELERAVLQAAEARSASISVAVVREGHIVYRFAAGTGRRDSTGAQAATPATAYHWGSMTKLVTATAIMRLVEQGRVSLDAPVDRYLPGFPAAPGITVRNLLTHSSGLAEREADHLVSFNGSTLPSLGQVLTSYLEESPTLAFKPGSDAAYNNWNFLVLGVLVERVSGKPYEEFVRDEVLRPLGMTHSAFRFSELPADTPLATPVIAATREPELISILNTGRPGKDADTAIGGREQGLSFLVDFDILAPWGGLEGTAEDVARFLAMSMGTPLPGAPRVLAPGTLASMRKVQRSTSGRVLPWGLGWMLGREQGEEVIEHGGGGAGIECLMRIYPRRQLGVVVMGNVENYGAARITAAAADIFSAGSN